MEEADLLKERLQAITNKRRIRENIAVKRRQIEEEKLKLQYIKKKALREQWLMDGLSQQSEEEQEAMRLQAQDEQQQSDQLQSNIIRIEKEIEDLEAQELDISANEEVVLKRLKEVERTPEDIIKELNAEFRPDSSHPVLSPPKHTNAVVPLTPAMTPSKREPDVEEPKKATFAMEITVERDKKTGQCQVVATANITPETFRDRGLKVYEDGRKSVYALNPDGGEPLNGTVGEMTPSQVEELLEQAVDKDVPSNVQYYQPVYSVTYAGNSRPSTPRTPNKSPKPSPSPCPSLGDTSPMNGTQTYLETGSSRTPILLEQEAKQRTKKEPIKGRCDVAEDQPHFGTKAPLGQTHHHHHHSDSQVNGPSLVSVKARTDAIPTAAQLLHTTVDDSRPLAMVLHTPEVNGNTSVDDLSRRSPFCSDSTATLNFVKTLPAEQQGSEPVTMIFMGYEKADNEDEDDFQAELVVVGNSSDEDEREEEDEAQYNSNGSDAEGCLSYHPEGYTSRIFRPTVGMAKISSYNHAASDAYTNWDAPALHKPTFIHKGVKHDRYLQGHGAEECADTGSINMEKMKLCSTGR